MTYHEINIIAGEKQGIKIDGYKNRWSAFESVDVNGTVYYIFENDTWGDITCYLVIGYVDDSPVEIYETYDGLEQCLMDEDIL